MKMLALLSFLAFSTMASAQTFDTLAKMVGIGIQADINDNGELIILGMVDRAPAALSGMVNIGDQIVGVQSRPGADMVDIAGMEMNEIGPLFAGTEGESLFMKLRRGEDIFVVELVRAEFEFTPEE